MIYLSLFILFFYALFILWTTTGVIKLPFSNPQHLQPKNKFSLLVPFKNEAENLPQLLHSLEKLNYPLNMYEVILIDDHSTDPYQKNISNFTIRILQNQGNGKKQALKTGIENAVNPWIFTTDADCTILSEVLRISDEIIQNNTVKMLLLPVRFQNSKKWLDQFQQIEFLSLQAVTIAGVYWKKPFLSNGAGLIFEKKTFDEVNGYRDNLQIASGDDVFLLEKFQKKYPGQISFVKNRQAVIQTRTQPDLKQLIQQKIRWSGKTRHHKSFLPKITGVIVALTNLLVIFSLISSPVNFITAFIILSKFIMDVTLFNTVNRFYQAKINPLYFVISFFIYPFYFWFVLILSMKGTYRWKEKTYHK